MCVYTVCYMTTERPFESQLQRAISVKAGWKLTDFEQTLFIYFLYLIRKKLVLKMK